MITRDFYNLLRHEKEVYADHKVITMRMAIEENSFSEKLGEYLCFERDRWTNVEI